MTFYETIMKRRSIRRFKDIPEIVVAYGMPAKVIKRKMFLYLKFIVEERGYEVCQ